MRNVSRSGCNINPLHAVYMTCTSAPDGGEGRHDYQTRLARPRFVAMFAATASLRRLVALLTGNFVCDAVGWT